MAVCPNYSPFQSVLIGNIFFSQIVLPPMVNYKRHLLFILTLTHLVFSPCLVVGGSGGK